MGKVEEMINITLTKERAEQDKNLYVVLEDMEPAPKRKKVEEDYNDGTQYGMDPDDDGMDGEDPEGHNPKPGRSNDGMMDVGEKDDRVATSFIKWVR